LYLHKKTVLVRQMGRCENGNGQRLVESKGTPDNEDIKFEDNSEKGDGDN
jgi:hypothetical protein